MAVSRRGSEALDAQRADRRAVNPRPVYLDSSAVVKLVFEEAETPALEAFLIDRPVRVSSSLARIEVMRAARSRGRWAGQPARRPGARRASP